MSGVSLSSCTAVSFLTREEVHDLIIALDLLKDESSEIDLVGPTLPALKSLLSVPCASPGDKATYGELVHALLSASLHHIDEMR